MKRIGFYLLILLLGCQKENNEINSTRIYFLGDYCGEITGDGWSSFNTTVWKSDADSNRIVFNNFVGDDSVEAIVAGFNLIFPASTYRITEHTSAGPWGHTYYYDLTVSGNGILDVSNYLLRINLTLLESYEDGTNKVTELVMKMYDSSKYSYIGTFAGDSTKVIISPCDDDFLLSITFPEDWIPGGWDSLKASDNSCYLSFSVDNIEDISSGEMYRVMGSGQKRGDSLVFKLFAYYHGVSPLYIYDFTVTKEP